MPKIKLSPVQRAFLTRLAESSSGSQRAYNGSAATYCSLQDKGLLVLTAQDVVTVYAKITDAGRAALLPLHDAKYLATKAG